MKPFALTAFALTAFAFNSILCRMALAAGEIDPASFTTVRLVSGAAVLAALLLASRKTLSVVKSGNWFSAFFLFAYAVAFSFAYLGLTTATGALILFGCVQLTMFGVSLYRGVRPGALEWVGLVVAFSGLVYLVLPGLSAPPLTSALLMAAAGITWGGYTLRGKGSENPLADTTGNFIRSVPMVFIVALLFLPNLTASWRGVGLAVLSGAIASGVGYSVWYAALKYHTPTRAAVLQLSVPIITAVLGILLLAETASWRLTTAGVLILGGIGLTLLRRKSS
jgi:drug/metabolite transporter (DMT)-like permease